MSTVQSTNATSVQAASTPPTQTYTIERGDTLSAIADEHGVSVSALLKANPGIHDPNRIYPGDRLHIPAHGTDAGSARPNAGSHGGDAKPNSAGQGGATATVKPGQLPDTKGLDGKAKYDLYKGYVEKFGSAQAKADLANGKQVVLALRHDTATTANGGHGQYDDRLVIVDGKTHQASEYKAGLDPISRYQGRYGQDVNHDGKLDLGRLADGNYTFYKSTYLGHAALKPSSSETVERDTNHDGKFTSADGPNRKQTQAGSSIADYVHIGGTTDTGSAGCLTLPPDQHAAFFGKLNGSSNIHLVMVDDNKLPSGASTTQPDAPTTKPAAPKSSPEPTTGAKPEHIGQKGLDLVKKSEGFSAHAYRDPVGVLTIGYGHTGNVKAGDTITKAEGEKLLKGDLKTAEDAVKKDVKVPLSEDQFDALTSFTFNLGTGALKDSTLLKKLNAGDYAGAQKEFGKWVHAGGKVLPGLVTRRAAEAKLFGDSAPSGAQKPSGGSDKPGANPNQGTGGAARTSDVTVRSGDTLSAIAARHGVSLSALLKANPQIGNPNLIFAGQTVHVPQSGTNARAASAPATTTPAATNGTGTSASAVGRNTVIRNADGTTETRSGGTLAWRNNNPGNIRAGAWANAHGAIGTGPGGFAVFPDRATGERAVSDLLQSGSYRNLSVADAIARWAPPSENDTGAYQRSVRDATGLDTSRAISDLSAAELSRVVAAIGHVEGWTAGTVSNGR